MSIYSRLTSTERYEYPSARYYCIYYSLLLTLGIERSRLISWNNFLEWPLTILARFYVSGEALISKRSLFAQLIISDLRYFPNIATAAASCVDERSDDFKKS